MFQQRVLSGMRPIGRLYILLRQIVEHGNECARSVAAETMQAAPGMAHR